MVEDQREADTHRVEEQQERPGARIEDRGRVSQGHSTGMPLRDQRGFYVIGHEARGVVFHGERVHFRQLESHVVNSVDAVNTGTGYGFAISIAHGPREIVG